MKYSPLLMVLVITGCANDAPVGHEELIEHVEGGQIGGDTDYWIEMHNGGGFWEKTGLIFGYLGDEEECLKAIDGMKRANPARVYRCTAASQ